VTAEAVDLRPAFLVGDGLQARGPPPGRQRWPRRGDIPLESGDAEGKARVMAKASRIWAASSMGVSMSTKSQQMLVLGGVVGVVPIADVDEVDLVRGQAVGPVDHLGQRSRRRLGP
jgi:hypothetical protein